MNSKQILESIIYTCENTFVEKNGTIFSNKFYFKKNSFNFGELTLYALSQLKQEADIYRNNYLYSNLSTLIDYIIDLINQYINCYRNNFNDNVIINNLNTKKVFGNQYRIAPSKYVSQFNKIKVKYLESFLELGIIDCSNVKLPVAQPVNNTYNPNNNTYNPNNNTYYPNNNQNLYNLNQSNIIIPIQYGDNKKIVKYFYKKIFQKWLYDDFEKLLKYFYIVKNKVKIIDNLSQYKKNKLKGSIYKKIIKYIHKNIFSKNDVKKLLDKFVLKKKVNYDTLNKKYKKQVKKKIFDKIKKKIINLIL